MRAQGGPCVVLLHAIYGGWTLCVVLGPWGWVLIFEGSTGGDTTSALQGGMDGEKKLTGGELRFWGVSQGQGVGDGVGIHLQPITSKRGAHPVIDGQHPRVCYPKRTQWTKQSCSSRKADVLGSGSPFPLCSPSRSTDLPSFLPSNP